MNDVLNSLGSWKNPDVPIHQDVVQAVLDELAVSAETGSDAFRWYRSVAASFARLTDSHYFSEVGRKLPIRQLCEAIQRAPELDACQSLERIIEIEHGSITKVDNFDVYRDGGSMAIDLFVNNNQTIPLFLQVGRDGHTPHELLYPCNYHERREFLPISVGSPNEQWLKQQISECVQEERVGDLCTVQQLQSFLLALNGRKKTMPN